MKFQLTNYRQQKIISDEVLIADLRKVAEANGGDDSRTLYDAKGEFSVSTFEKRFGSWHDALVVAGLNPRPKTQRNISDEVLLADLRRVAEANGGNVSMRTYNENGEFSSRTLANRLGSWNDALKAAGLAPKTQGNISDEDLLTDLRKVAEANGGNISKSIYEMNGEFRKETIIRRFGSWNDSLKAAGLPVRIRISDEDLLKDLHKVGDANGGNVSERIYKKNGAYRTSTIRGRFGNWNKALIASGFSPSQSRNSISSDDLLEDLRKSASKFGGRITLEQYNSVGKFSAKPFKERFGSWSKALISAGLEANLARNLSDDELFENLEEVWLKLGRQPKYVEFETLSRFSGATYAARFGSWKKAIEKFVEVANGESSEAELDEPTENSHPSIDSNEDSIVAKAAEANTLPSVEVGMKHKTKREISWRMRWKVISRDYYKCVACGRAPAKDPSVELHVDHIKPWSKGGETVLENLQTLCGTCNLGKGNLE